MTTVADLGTCPFGAARKQLPPGRVIPPRLVWACSLGFRLRPRRQSCAAASEKKAGVVEHLEVFDHAGLLVNEPPTRPGCPSSSHPTNSTEVLRGVSYKLTKDSTCSFHCMTRDLESKSIRRRIAAALTPTQAAALLSGVGMVRENSKGGRWPGCKVDGKEGDFLSPGHSRECRSFMSFSTGELGLFSDYREEKSHTSPLASWYTESVWRVSARPKILNETAASSFAFLSAHHLPSQFPENVKPCR